MRQSCPGGLPPNKLADVSRQRIPRWLQDGPRPALIRLGSNPGSRQRHLRKPGLSRRVPPWRFGTVWALADAPRLLPVVSPVGTLRILWTGGISKGRDSAKWCPAAPSLKSERRRTSPVHPPSQTHGLDLRSWSTRLRFDPLAGLRAGASTSGNCRPSSDAARVLGIGF